jgi:hypothetical protein
MCVTSSGHKASNYTLITRTLNYSTWPEKKIKLPKVEEAAGTSEQEQALEYFWFKHLLLHMKQVMHRKQPAEIQTHGSHLHL